MLEDREPAERTFLRREFASRGGGADSKRTRKLAGKTVDLGGFYRPAVIGFRPRRRGRALHHIQAIHIEIAFAYTPPQHEIMRITRGRRTGRKEVRVDTDNYLRRIKLIYRIRVSAECEARAFTPPEPNRFPLNPLGAWIQRDQIFDLGSKRGRRNGFR